MKRKKVMEINKIRGEKGNITIDATKIQGIIKEYFFKTFNKFYKEWIIF
jgi:hypothetical protein